jgi:hypothetical protein
MTISTYTELQSAVADWMHRTGDTTFTTYVPDFIRLAEARFNRALRVSDMEADFASTALTNGAATLPSDFLAFKELRFDGSTDYTLRPKSLEWIRAQDNLDTGDAQYFAVAKSTVICWPTTGPIKGTYYQQIPALASNSTNWLLTDHPDLYLFASLVEACLWAQDDSRLPFWAEKASALLDAVQRSDDRNQFDGGILSVSVR